MVLLLGDGELAVGVAWHTGGGCIAIFRGDGFTVCTTTEASEAVVDCATLVRQAGAGLSVWLSGVGEAMVEVSSESWVMEVGVGGGAGAFLFLCWLSEPRPT